MLIQCTTNSPFASYSLPNWLKPNSDYFGGWIYWLDTGHIVAFFSPDKLLSAMYCTFHISFYISFWLCVFCAVSSFLPYRIIHHNTHGLPCFFFGFLLWEFPPPHFVHAVFFAGLLFRALIIAKRLWLWCLIITIYMFMKRSLRFKLHWAWSTNFALKRASILCRWCTRVVRVNSFIFFDKNKLSTCTHCLKKQKKWNKITERFIYRCCFKRVQLKL